MRSNRTNLISWCALVIAVGAFVLAWKAYNQVSEERIEVLLQNRIAEITEHVKNVLDKPPHEK